MTRVCVLAPSSAERDDREHAPGDDSEPAACGVDSERHAIARLERRVASAYCQILPTLQDRAVSCIEQAWRLAEAHDVSVVTEVEDLAWGPVEGASVAPRPRRDV